MHKSWLLCVLMGALAWGQAAPGTAAPPQTPPAASAGPTASPAAPADTSAEVPLTAAVITVDGVCPAQAKTSAAAGAAAKTEGTAKTPTKASSTDCKTVITRADFEKIVAALSPTNPLSPPQKKRLASDLGRFIAMSDQAKKEGLDKTAQYKETVKLLQMQILSRELQENIQEEAAKVPPDEVEKYYNDHLADFEQYGLQRLFVPRTKQVEPDAKADAKDEKLSEEEQKAKQDAEKAKADEAVQAMSQLADSLRARAAAGEDFVKLQKEAFEVAGMKIDSPNVAIPTARRNALPPAHAAVFDLKPGEVSQVINDAGGHYIYKVTSREQLPLDQKVQNEIHSLLQNQRSRDLMEKLNKSFEVETNEAYFGAGGPPMGMPRPPGARMTPRPMPPDMQSQTPPPAQPAAAPKPD